MLGIHALPGEGKGDLVSGAFVWKCHECHLNAVFWPVWEQTAIRISKGTPKGMFQIELPTSTQMTYQENAPTETQQKELKSLHVLNAFDHNIFVAEKYRQLQKVICQQPL